MDQINDSLDQIFQNALKHPTILKDRNVLRSDYIPNHLPFRTDQITSIGQLLSPLIRSTKPSNLLLYGKTGTGKTAVTKYVTKRLQETCNTKSIHSNFAYSNTKTAGTEYRVLTDLATAIGVKIPFTGLAVTEVFSRIQQHIKSNQLHVVLILDEIDYLIKNFGDDLLYNLTNSTDSINPAFLSLIGISNDLQFKEELGARVLSRLSEEELVFPPYSASQLQTILLERANLALYHETYSEAAINLCAALSGSEHGDARRAVDLLRIATEVAERENAPILEEKHVRTALQKIDQDRVLEALKTLPLHAKLVLLACSQSQNEQNHSSGSIYQKYHNLCSPSGLEPLTSRRVSGILSELDTLGLISATLVNYGRYGRTKKILPKVAFTTLTQAFSDDSILKSLTQGS